MLMNIHLTNICNYADCDICFEKLDLNNPCHLDKDKLFKFLDDMKPQHVGFVGEPLTHPDINEILQYCKDRKYHTCLVTNGALLETLAVQPDFISIGIDNDQLWNKPIIEWLEKTNMTKNNIEITITPKDLTVIDELIDFYKDKCLNINFSLLAFWDIKPVTAQYITPEYKAKIKELKERKDVNLSFFGDNFIDDFYNQELAADCDYYCNSVLNVYPDGHLEFCDIQNYPTGMTIESYDKDELDKLYQINKDEFVVKEHCKYCSLRRVKDYGQ